MAILPLCGATHSEDETSGPPADAESPCLQVGYRLLPPEERLLMCSYPLLRFPATHKLAKDLGEPLEAIEDIPGASTGFPGTCPRLSGMRRQFLTHM